MGDMANMTDMTNFVGILVFGFGIYSLYAAFQMKVKGEINSSLLLSKELIYKKCKDKEAYIKEVFPVLLVFAIVTTLCGAIDIINSFVVDISIVYFISLAAFVAVFAVFVVKTTNARKKYY